MSYFRTLPNKHMEKIVETLAKFKISALLVIGGFEVLRHNPSKSQNHTSILFYRVSVTSKRFSIFLLVTFKGIRRCAAAV